MLILYSLLLVISFPACQTVNRNTWDCKMAKFHLLILPTAFDAYSVAVAHELYTFASVLTAPQSLTGKQAYFHGHHDQ